MAGSVLWVRDSCYYCTYCTYLPKSSIRHDIRSGTCVGSADTEAFHDTLPIKSSPSYVRSFKFVRPRASGMVYEGGGGPRSNTWTRVHAFTLLLVGG
jgi:hypothetical protein